MRAAQVLGFLGLVGVTVLAGSATHWNDDLRPVDRVLAMGPLIEPHGLLVAMGPLIEPHGYSGRCPVTVNQDGRRVGCARTDQVLLSQWQTGRSPLLRG